MSASTIKRGRQFFANNLHRQLFLIISAAAVIPTVLTAIGLFYLIFNITAEQIGIPEAIAYNLLPAARRVVSILLVVLPLCIATILYLAHRMTHRIVGPYDRIVRELGEALENTKKGPIIVRPTDRFKPLVTLINTLLEKRD